MPGRGGGKSTGNRNIPPRSIAPGRLQTINQVARFNLCNKQDGASIGEKVKAKSTADVLTKQKGPPVSEVNDDIAIIVSTNIARQRTQFTGTNREIECPNLTHDNLQCTRNDSHNVQDVETNDVESQGFVASIGQLAKRKRTSKLAARVASTLQVNEAANPKPREESLIEEEEQGNGVSTQSDVVGHNPETQATSQTRGIGNRGKYKSYVVDMKIKGKGSKLAIEIPDEIDRAIGENARHLVNECGRVVRTKAPLDVKNWQEAFSVAGESMWKEIQDLKMYAFVVDTMQRLYRLWKCRLHYYYKSPKCGKTDQERLKNPPLDLPLNQWTYCVNHYSSPEFKLVSERNSRNRLSAKRCKHTTGNLAFAEVEDILTKENNNVKPSADVIWLVQHTHCNKEGELEWADDTHSKEIHDKLKDVVATVGDSMTQEEILVQVLEPRSGYIRGKGTALRGYSRGKQQLEQRKVVEKQQQKIQEQENRIRELEDTQRKQQQELEEYKRQQQEAMDAFKKDLLEQLANRGI